MARGHPDYPGYAWYRRTVTVTAGPASWDILGPTFGINARPGDAAVRGIRRDAVRKPLLRLIGSDQSRRSASANGEMAQVRWTPQAVDDLEAICLFIARDAVLRFSRSEQSISLIVGELPGVRPNGA